MTAGDEYARCSKCSWRGSVLDAPGRRCPAMDAAGLVCGSPVHVALATPAATPTARPKREPTITSPRISPGPSREVAVASASPVEPSLRVAPVGTRFQITNDQPGNWQVLTLSRASFEEFIREGLRLLAMPE